MSDATPGDDTNEESGLGTEGTIPSGSAGVGIGAGEANTFEPEEDPDAEVGGDSAAPGDGAAGFSGHS